MDSVVKPPLIKPGPGNLRAYVAGTGATGALIGGAVIVFLSALAFVAFNGFSLPGSADDSSIALNSTQPTRIGNAPIAAANAVGPGAGAVAATPKAVGVTGTAGSGATGPGSTAPASSAPADSSAAPGEGPVTGVVSGVDDTTGGAIAPVSDATAPITAPVDDAVGNTLNQAGGAVGNPHLGDDVNGTVKDVTDGVVGQNGLLGN